MLTKRYLQPAYFLFPHPFLPPQLFLSLLADFEPALWGAEFFDALFWSLLCCLVCCDCAGKVPVIKPERHAAVISDLKLNFIFALRFPNIQISGFISEIRGGR